MAIGDLPRAGLKLLTMLKTVQINYSEIIRAVFQDGWIARRLLEQTLKVCSLV